jgi:hypothetical protein
MLRGLLEWSYSHLSDEGGHLKTPLIYSPIAINYEILTQCVRIVAALARDVASQRVIPDVLGSDICTRLLRLAARKSPWGLSDFHKRLEVALVNLIESVTPDDVTDLLSLTEGLYRESVSRALSEEIEPRKAADLLVRVCERADDVQINQLVRSLGQLSLEIEGDDSKKAVMSLLERIKSVKGRRFLTTIAAVH